MTNESREIPEIIEREAQELSDLLTQVIERAEALKRRLGNSNLCSNSLGSIHLSFPLREMAFLI